MNSQSTNQLQIVAIVPAAGVGSRMKADRPKQYLSLFGKTVLEHTVEKLLMHPLISNVIVAVSEKDRYFSTLSIAHDPRITRVIGGKERADTVLKAVDHLLDHQSGIWTLVHDAARPCVDLADIDELIIQASVHPVGAILASPVRDTMKRSNERDEIAHTVEREQLWHALTPQLFPAQSLQYALRTAIQSGAVVTDEASAFESIGLAPKLVLGKASNIKITQPEDLALAEFYLSRDKEQ